MKRKIFTISFIALSALCTMAKMPKDVLDHLGFNLGVGTDGISVEASTPLSRFVQMRAGVSIMPGIKFNTEADAYYYDKGYEHYTEVDLSASLSRVQGKILFNVYPAPKVPFYVAVGAFFGGNDLLKINGYSPELAETGGIVQIGDYEFEVPDGYVRGGIRVKSFRPYVGIGWGRAVPQHRVNFSLDLGVQFHGKPSLYSNTGDVDVSEFTDDDTIQKILDYAKFYPTLTFRLGFRAF